MAVLAVSQSACALITAERKVEEQRLKLSIDALNLLQTQLPSITEGSHDVYLVLSANTINQVLAAADKLELPIPRVKTAVIRINSVRYVPENGAGVLAVDAAAFDKRRNITLAVTVAAALAIEPAPNGVLQARVDVRDLKPVFSWRCLRLPLLGLGYRVLNTAVGDWSLRNLSFPLPTKQVFDVGLPPPVSSELTFPLGQATATARLSTPTVDPLKRQLDLKAVWFLKDGVHVWANVLP